MSRHQKPDPPNGADEPFEPSGTRRDEPSGTRRDEPSGTRRDEPSGTRRDEPSGTRRDEPSGSHAVDPGHLPAPLAGRFARVRQLEGTGAEADVYAVVDHDGTSRVLKLYRFGIRPDERALRTLGDLREPHLVQLHETAVATDGRRFEIMEHVAGGTLREWAEEVGALPVATVTAMVDQLVAALCALQDAGITHRDLKPENVLVKSRDPAHLQLGDYGLSRQLDQSMVHSTAARSIYYAAPETFKHQVSPKRDWWSLGVIVRELVTGERLYLDRPENAIPDAIASEPIPLDDVTDERLHMLCGGLLVKEPADRWGRAEVEEWAAGGSPHVAEQIDTSARRPFVFADVEYRDHRLLAAALAVRWDTARRRFFNAPVPLDRLLRWYGDVSARAVDDEARDADLARMTSVPEDVGMVMLLAHLDPHQSPVYRGVPITPPDLRGLVATAAVNGYVDSDVDESRGVLASTPARAVIEDLWDGRVVDVLEERGTTPWLRPMTTAWHEAWGHWRRVVDELTAVEPRTASTLRDGAVSDEVRCQLLGRALGVDDTEVVRALDAERADLPRPVPWFDYWCERAAHDGIAALAGFLVAQIAREQALEEQAAEEAHRQRIRARREWWQENEARRIDGRASALARAGSGLALVALPFLLVFVPSASVLSTLSGIATFAVVAALEFGLAFELAGAYHPRFSMIQGFGRRAGPLGASWRRYPIRGTLLLLLFLGPVITVLIAVRVLAAIVVVVLVGIWVWRRRNGWSTEYQHHEQEAMAWA